MNPGFILYAQTAAKTGTADLGKTPIFVMICYILLLIGLGLYGFIKSKMTEDDYYLAGRKQNFLITALTIMATFFSSAALLGIPGAVYRDGAAFVFFALNLPVSGAAVYLLGSRITRIGRKRGYVTPADMLADYYGNSNMLRLLIAIVGMLYVIPYVIIQVRAGGHLAQQIFPNVEPVTIFNVTLNMFDMGAVLLAGVMTLYVLIGGMRSVALADTVQGSLLLVGMLISGAAIIFALGGVGGFFKEVAKLPPEALSFPGATGRYSPTLLLTICIFGSLGSMIQPAQWMRYYAASSTKTLKQSALLFSLLLPCCFLFGVMLVGLGARALYPPMMIDGALTAHETVGSFDQALVAVLRNYGPQMFGALGPLIVSMILMAILAASMSTADSNLHAFSAVFTRDVYDRFLHPTASQKERAWVGRIVIILTALAALVLVHVGEHSDEFKPLKMIVEMMFVAIAFSCQVLPVALDMLFIRRGTKAGAVWGMIAGLVTVLFFTPAPHLLLGDGLPEGYSTMIFDLKKLFDIGFYGFMVNTIVFVGVSMFTKSLDPEHVETFKNEM